MCGAVCDRAALECGACGEPLEAYQPPLTQSLSNFEKLLVYGVLGGPFLLAAVLIVCG